MNNQTYKKKRSNNNSNTKRVEPYNLSLLWLCQTWWWRREGNKESVSCSEGGNLAVDFEVDEDFGFYQNIRRPQVYGIGTIHIRISVSHLFPCGEADSTTNVTPCCLFAAKKIHIPLPWLRCSRAL
jgi:hypothetical protein